MLKTQANSPSHKFFKTLFNILLLSLIALSQIGGCNGGDDGGGSQSTAPAPNSPPETNNPSNANNPPENPDNNTPPENPDNNTPPAAETPHLGTWVGVDQSDNLVNFQVEEKNSEDVTKFNCTLIFTNLDSVAIYNTGVLDTQVPITSNESIINGGNTEVNYSFHIYFDSPDECHGTWTATAIKLEATKSGEFSARKSNCSDDHGNSAATATKLDRICNFIDGNIECAQDEDWFSFPAAAGHTYTIKTGEYLDSYIYLLDTDGQSVIAENDDSGSYGINSKIVWTAGVSGTYYVKVRYQNSIAGKYTLSIIDENNCVDDHANSPSGATLITPCTPINAFIEHDTDEDWFSVQLAAGTIYIAQTGGNMDTDLHFIERDGETELLVDDDSGPDLSARLEFTVSQPGKYYLRVLQTNLLGTGAYSLEICPKP